MESAWERERGPLSCEIFSTLSPENAVNSISDCENMADTIYCVRYAVHSGRLSWLKNQS